MFGYENYREELDQAKADVARLSGVVECLETEIGSIRKALRLRKMAAKADGSSSVSKHAATVETKPCQHCGEVIRRAAKVCKVCKLAQPESYMEIGAVEGEIARLRLEARGGLLQTIPTEEPLTPAA
ncbi:MAG: hypothetical protein KIT00_01870 [Rhodospirillales bacterium]|nr:hypothetical protein [Rhodospirillales bacterium]